MFLYCLYSGRLSFNVLMGCIVDKDAKQKYIYILLLISQGWTKEARPYMSCKKVVIKIGIFCRTRTRDKLSLTNLKKVERKRLSPNVWTSALRDVQSFNSSIHPVPQADFLRAHLMNRSHQTLLI